MEESSNKKNINASQDLSALMAMGLPDEALSGILDAIKTEKKTNEEPSNKKIHFNANQDMSALMAMGLPPEVLMTLNAIKTSTEAEEDQHLKKVVIDNNKKDLSHLHGMGLPDEVIQTLRGIKSEDFKVEQAKSQAREAQAAKEAQLAWQTKENKAKNDLVGLKFNPLTGTFDMPKDKMLSMMKEHQNNVEAHLTKTQISQNITHGVSEQKQENFEMANFDSLLNFSSPINVVSEIQQKQPDPTPVSEAIVQNPSEIDELNLGVLNKLAGDLNNTNPNINVSTTIDYNEQEQNALIKSFQISEEGVFLGIILNITKKSEAIAILNNHCETKYPLDYIDNILSYDDKGITMYVEDDLVNQLEFKKGFDGVTSKGLKLGDNVSQALEIYGKPMMKTPRGAVWKNFKIFYEKEIIHSIKIQR